MKLEIASWNDGITGYNALAEETAIINFSLDARFNEHATCTIVLSDPTGALAQKYNVDTNDVYVGPGKVELEHPTATDIFKGRIVKVRHNSQTGKTVLYCADWGSQLEDRRITYDMREALDDAGLRQSEVKSDVGDETMPVSQTFMYAVADDGGATTDQTTAAANTTANDMTLLPAAPAANDAYYFGMSAAYDRIKINVGTAGAGTWTITWEYLWDCTEAWIALTDIVDGTNGFKTAGECEVSWGTLAAPIVSCNPLGVGAAYWIRARVSAFTAITTQPLGTQAWQPQKLYDDDMTFDADEWNNKFLVFPAEAAGEVTISAGPYAATLSANIDTENGDYDDLWVDDANYHELIDNDISFTVDYDFHINAELGSLYSSGPTAGNIILAYMITTTNAVNTHTLKVRVKDADEAYTTIDVVEFSTETTSIRRMTIPIPSQYLSNFVDTLGEATIQFEVSVTGGDNTTYRMYYCRLELTYGLAGTSSAYPIVDTTSNEIHTTANLTYNGLGIWEGCPYCVADYIKNHIPTLITDHDPLIELSTSVEATTGVSTRHYEERTPWEIIKDLAEQEGAVVYVPLGGVTVTYKKTFNAGAPTALTDALVLNWHNCEYDYEPMRNEYHIYGIRIGDEQLYRNTADLTTDPGLDSKSTYGTIRSEVFKGTGLLSQYEVDEYGEAIVEKNEDVKFLLSAELPGLDSTFRLATEVAITSTRLGLTAINYTVIGWRYDSSQNTTMIDLHPRVSVGYSEKVGDFGVLATMRKATVENKVDKYVPSLTGQEW